MGFETVVRPTVLPDIRPAPPRTLPAPSDGSYATIRGNGGKSVTLSHSFSASASTSQKVEYKRRSTKVRVYQKNSPVNKDNFIDFEIANKIWMRGGAAPGSSGSVQDEREAWSFTDVKEADNIEILQRNKISEGSGGG